MQWGAKSLQALIVFVMGGLALAPCAQGSTPVQDSSEPVADSSPPDPDLPDDTESAVQQAQQVGPMRPTAPLPATAPTPAGTQELIARLRGGAEIDLTQLSEERRARASGPATQFASGSESLIRSSTDTASLLAKSQSTPGVGVQKRTPIVTDPRTRGNHTGQTLASGSYWVPARLDLDTMLSKIDSSIIGNVIVIKGPYSARYGPGFSFIDAEILGAPRFSNGLEWHGRTSLSYQTNGEQWSGRQSIMGGSSDWGFRVGYGHRTGNDYETGDGRDIPSSYNSRDIDTALGLDLTSDSHLELSYLRLDQTGVEFPGQIFDIDFLVTDGFEVSYVLENQAYFDRLTCSTWYNRTRFEGNAQNSGKRRQIPELDLLGFIGFTDVDAMSTGYRLAGTWGETGCRQLALGADLRFVKEGLNEFNRFCVGGVPGFCPLGERMFTKFIPRSHLSNPGLFIEYVRPLNECLILRTGARVDWVSTGIDEEIDPLPDTPSFHLWSGYMTAEYELENHWTASGGFGYAMRPPTLTELYSVGPFMALLQQGGNFVFGNQALDPERLWQLDLGLKADYGRWRAGIGGFYAWIHDYITPEITLHDPVTNLRLLEFVNTDLATLSGGEVFAEYDCNDWLTPFATVSYVEGRDHSRGDRGIIPGSSEEPLPGIAPLESRLGLRLHEPAEKPHWGIELAARIVDNQDRVASSLLEKPTAGFTTYDLRSFWQATDCLLLVAGIENLTDKNYREHLDLRTGRGVFQPGANFYFGFELSY